MTTSLGLTGDLDDVELIEDIEGAFGIRFSDNQLESCRTVGDVFALIEARISGERASATRCATSMCFYSMRRTLQSKLDAQLRPTTPIDRLKRLSVRELRQIINKECGFRPPSPILSVWGCVALLLVGLLPVASVALGFTWWLAAASALPGIWLYTVAPIHLPKDVVTFGDLVRIVAARNIGQLAAQGARLRTPEAWTAFRDVAAGHTALPREAISRDTLIFAERATTS